MSPYRKNERKARPSRITTSVSAKHNATTAGRTKQANNRPLVLLLWPDPQLITERLKSKFENIKW